MVNTSMVNEVIKKTYYNIYIEIIIKPITLEQVSQVKICLKIIYIDKMGIMVSSQDADMSVALNTHYVSTKNKDQFNFIIENTRFSSFAEDDKNLKSMCSYIGNCVM